MTIRGSMDSVVKFIFLFDNWSKIELYVFLHFIYLLSIFQLNLSLLSVFLSMLELGRFPSQSTIELVTR